MASATNIALAIELYLKALWILVAKRVPNEHNLWTLYKHLPQDLRQKIEEAYSQVPTRPEFEAVALEIVVAPPGCARQTR